MAKDFAKNENYRSILKNFLGLVNVDENIKAVDREDGLRIGSALICTLIDVLADITDTDALELGDEIANTVVKMHLEYPALYK